MKFALEHVEFSVWVVVEHAFDNSLYKQVVVIGVDAVGDVRLWDAVIIDGHRIVRLVEKVLKCRGTVRYVLFLMRFKIINMQKRSSKIL